MASSITIGYALWMDGSTFNAQLGRQAHIAASWLNSQSAQVYSGVMPTGGSLAVAAGSGMQVVVSSGYCVIASSSGSTYGGYLCAAMQATSLSVAASDPVNQ